MITIFNRKELLTTTDMKLQGKARDILAAAGIPYKVFARTRTPARRGMTFGADLSISYVYKIYVHKNDHAHAVYLLQKNR